MRPSSDDIRSSFGVTASPNPPYELRPRLVRLQGEHARQDRGTVMTKVNKLGKGIILMHDFQKHTAEALPTLLSRLKAGGYKAVQMKTKASLQTLAEHDAEVVKDAKLPTISARPV